MFGKEIEIPEEWKYVNIKYIANKLLSGGTPSTLIADYWQGGIPWTKGAVLITNNTIEGETFISELGLKNSSTSIIPKNNLLIVSRVSIGNVSINKIDIAISQDITAVILDKTKCITEFIYWNILETISILISFSQGTTIQGITRKDLSSHKVLLPPLPEQQKIASILSGVDALIESTQKTIESTEKLKKGLMQKLLTRGIGHEKFKKVKWMFGKEIEIPEEWDYPKFLIVVKTNPFTKIEKEKCPYIPMDAVDTSKSHFNYFEERNIKEHPSLTTFQENDVLFARITPSTENGKTCIVENFSKKGIVSSELTVLRATKDVYPKYLYYTMKSYRIRQFAISQMMGTTGRQRVPDYVFKKDLHFELPSYSEQKQIASILSGVDAQIVSQTQYKEKIERLKKSLMQKLLTGQVRVKV